MFDKEEKPNASKKETDVVAAFPVHGIERTADGGVRSRRSARWGEPRNRPL